MKTLFKRSALQHAVLVTCLGASSGAYAGATILFGEDKSLSAGFGFITSYASVENGAGNGTDRSNDFALNHARIYLSGSFNKYIKGMFNTERSGGGEGNIEVIDANVQFQLTPQVAIWAGRFLSPSDRANMAGPFYSMGGGYWANVVSRYGWNGGVIGRDEGVALVTSFLEDKLAISFGAFEGDNIFRFSGVGALEDENSSIADDMPMFAGRVQVNLLEGEPGYYGTGNYFGAKDVLAIGLAGRVKKDGAVSQQLNAGGANVTGDYESYSIDFLFEKKSVGPGTFSAEAAYYWYDTDGVFLGEEGEAYSVGLAYLFDAKVGWGRFMPFVRFQEFMADGGTSGVGVNTAGSVDTQRLEVGANYIIEPYNAFLTAYYGETEVTGAGDTDSFTLALQMQF
jgi:hypothetical protein